MSPLQDEQKPSSTPPSSLNFRAECREMFRELGYKLINVDLTLYPTPGQYFGVRFGLWILDKIEKK